MLGLKIALVICLGLAVVCKVAVFILERKNDK